MKGRTRHFDLRIFGTGLFLLSGLTVRLSQIEPRLRHVRTLLISIHEFTQGSNRLLIVAGKIKLLRRAEIHLLLFSFRSLHRKLIGLDVLEELLRLFIL